MIAVILLLFVSSNVVSNGNGISNGITFPK